MRVILIYKVFIIPLFLFCHLATVARAQESRVLEPIICYHSNDVKQVRIGIDKSALRTAALSDFQVTYEGVPEEAKVAFEAAVSIWEKSIQSSVPIMVKVSWSSLPNGSLASSGATTIYRNFDRNTISNVWYPVPLAEKIAKRSFNSSAEFDLTIKVNENVAWYFETDGNTPSGSIDFVSVILHELAHGLGIISSADVKDNNGILKDSGYPLIFDYFLENGQRKKLTTFSSPSRELEIQFTSNNLYFDSETLEEVGKPSPKLYAPGFFDVGSSISHLDENYYPAGNPNSLMSPQFARGEAIHDPGEVLLAMLMDIGWGTPDNEKPRTNMIAFPIPATGGVINIAFSKALSNKKVRIIDAVGREVYKIVYNESSDKEVLNLKFLPLGVYYIVASTSEGEFKKRIIIN